MGKRLLKIRQHLWLPSFGSQLPVKLTQLLQLFDVLCVIQSQVDAREALAQLIDALTAQDHELFAALILLHAAQGLQGTRMLP